MQRRWITVKAAAEYLNIHPVSVRRLIDRGEIPSAKIGRSVRVDFQALEQKLESKSKGTN